MPAAHTDAEQATRVEHSTMQKDSEKLPLNPSISDALAEAAANAVPV